MDYLVSYETIKTWSYYNNLQWLKIYTLQLPLIK